MPQPLRRRRRPLRPRPLRLIGAGGIGPQRPSLFFCRRPCWRAEEEEEEGRRSRKSRRRRRIESFISSSSPSPIFPTVALDGWFILKGADEEKRPFLYNKKKSNCRSRGEKWYKSRLDTHTHTRDVTAQGC